MIPLVVVDYNTIEKTIEYIKHFRSKCEERDQIATIIVDNYQAKTSMELLIKNYPEYKSIKIHLGEKEFCVYQFTIEKGIVFYCQSLENGGYAKGNNLGTIIADTLLNYPPYYIISNNDLIFEDSFQFSRLVRIFNENKRIAVIGPQIVSKEGYNQSPRKKVSATKKLILAPWLSTWPFNKDIDLDYTNESKECYWVSGCFLIVQADDFRKAGRFDENTFMFAEEMILSERLKLIGKSMWFCNDITLIHDHGSTIKRNNASKQSEKWSLESLQYFYKHYMRCNAFVIFCSNMNLSIYRAFRNVSRKIRRT